MIIKATCLNCGKEVEGELLKDELGPHMICPECEASFDVEVYMSQEQFDNVKAKLEQMVDDGWEISKMVACIYDLFQEYIISETQEQILYQIADPFEDYNECGDYWREMDYGNPLLQILR